jgi:hypothetical protein
MKKQQLKRLANKYGASLTEFTPYHYRFSKQPFGSIDFYPTKNKYTLTGTQEFKKTHDIEGVIASRFNNPLPEMPAGQKLISDWCVSNGAAFIKQSNTACIISRGVNRIHVNHILRRYEHLNTNKAGTFRGAKNINTFLKALEKA